MNERDQMIIPHPLDHFDYFLWDDDLVHGFTGNKFFIHNIGFGICSNLVPIQFFRRGKSKWKQCRGGIINSLIDDAEGIWPKNNNGI